MESFAENVIQIPVNEAGTAAWVISERFKKVSSSAGAMKAIQAISNEDHLFYIRKNEKAILSVL
jgi:hypothetical protein